MEPPNPSQAEAALSVASGQPLPTFFGQPNGVYPVAPLQYHPGYMPPMHGMAMLPHGMPPAAPPHGYPPIYANFYPYYGHPPPVQWPGARDDGHEKDEAGRDSKDSKDGKGKGKGEREDPPEKLGGKCWEVPLSETKLKLIRDICPADARWSHSLADESRRSFAGYLPQAVDAADRKRFFGEIRDGTKWVQPENRDGDKIKRKTAWMVSSGCKCRYRYGGIEVDPIEFPPWMEALMRSVMPKCGLSEKRDWPNSCNLNLYEDGGMSVGWHSDDERLFQGKFSDCRILSLSLGVARKFELRLNWPEDGEKSIHRMLLGDGDICSMEGMVQKHFQHRVPRDDHIEEPRINLTWRWVKQHVPRCPVKRHRR